VGLHPVFNTTDVYGDGQPTAIAHAGRDVRSRMGCLPVSERIGERLFAVPWFKHDRRDQIDEYVSAIKKVAANYADLLDSDPGNPPDLGGWHFYQSI
jgi:perosamine synthetase